MRGDFTIDLPSKTIYLSRSFEKNARKQGTPEYHRFVEYLKIYNGYTFEKCEYNTKASQRRYKGMTYEWMRKYIKRHETEANAKLMLDKLETLLLDLDGVSKGYRYPTIKHWFLLNYPELKDAGKFAEAREQDLQQDPQQAQVVPLKYDF